MDRRRFLILAACCCAPALAQTADPPAHTNFSLRRPEIASFVAEAVEHDGLDRATVRRLIRAAQPQPKIVEIMNRPIEKVAPWWQYREHFVTPERIADGARFLGEHEPALARAAAAYQVPAEIIVAIIGVETNYGRNVGGYRALDALATLAFDYPPRQKYFRRELAEFMVLMRDNKLDPLAVKGSYAGALGVPQFMPSQYRRYGVAAQAGAHCDLWSDWDDIFASVANYLREHGWAPGTPVLADARLEADAPVPDPHGLDLTDTLDSLAAHGVRVDTSLPGATPAVLILAEEKDGNAWRVGFTNFRVITRYNASARYAMAVNDLAAAIAQARTRPAAAEAAQ